MERLGKWFGGGKSEKTAIKQEKGGDHKLATRNDPTATDSMTTATSTSTTPTTAIPQTSAASRDVNEPTTRVGQLMNQGREMILRVIPLTEGDCLSCKLIGSGIMFGAAGFVLYNAPKAKKHFTGFRRILFVIQVGSLTTGLTLLGTIRLLDMSIFTPPDADGKRKTFAELVTEDFKNFYEIANKWFPKENNSSKDK